MCCLLHSFRSALIERKGKKKREITSIWESLKALVFIFHMSVNLCEVHFLDLEIVPLKRREWVVCRRSGRKDVTIFVKSLLFPVLCIIF